MTIPRYYPISKFTVGSGGISEITFTSIPQTFKDLLLNISLRTTNTAYTVADVYLNINNSSSKMSVKMVYSSGTATGSTGYSNGDYYWTLSAASNTATTNTFSNSSLYFPNYSKSDFNKPFILDSVTETNSAASVNVGFFAGLYGEAKPITGMKFTCDNTFMQYSTVALYGIGKP